MDTNSEVRKITFWHLFLAHHPFSEWNRTLRFKLFGRELVLCTRCTGQYSTFLVALLIGCVYHWKVSMLVTYLLPLPATLDWLTQALKLRESNTGLRLTTGGIFGIWLANVLLGLYAWNTNVILHTAVQIGGYVSFVLFMLALKKGSVDAYLKPYEDYVDEYKRQKKG